ncbi:Suppressor of the cold-sensitive snRNP bioproteinsis mutant brr1-1 [Perkinsus olseni]|uniref:subtilisin n=1 Tax=Perkinsus olseni TaxID=32597 RepID=A0A7J6NAF3_PEROL|nr:Suppressor of the cold-sensitive snRNP bioproteinsis mutant brr1-1 [Perkinsus olseni]
MKLLSVVPLIAASSSADVYDSKTVLSVTSGDAFVDVRDVPQRLENAKFASNPEVAAFLKTASIKTLKSSGLQMVSTSDDTVSSADLCAYLKNAASELPGLECECSPNFATKEETTDDDLGVNDPNASWQRAFKLMNMKEVWRLSRPYARRTVKVAVMDSGLNFSDPEISSYRGIFYKKSGGFISGGWNFVDDSSNFTSANQHGQQCARLIAARRNNNHDMAGMSSNVRLASLKTQREDGHGSWWHMAEAMDMAVDIGVDIVSISLGEFISKSFADGVITKSFKAATDKGIIVVASAGNNDTLADTHYPCPLPGVICVGSIDIQDTLQVSRFSNYAPGARLSRAPSSPGAAAILLSMGVKPKYVAGMLTYNVDRFYSPLRPLKRNAGSSGPAEGRKDGHRFSGSERSPLIDFSLLGRLTKREILSL